MGGMVSLGQMQVTTDSSRKGYLLFIYLMHKIDTNIVLDKVKLQKKRHEYYCLSMIMLFALILNNRFLLSVQRASSFLLPPDTLYLERGRYLKVYLIISELQWNYF